MTGREQHDKAYAAAIELVNRLPLTDADKAEAMQRALDLFRKVSLELANLGASRETVSAVIAAALKYSDTFWANLPDDPEAEIAKRIPNDPKAHYTATGEWKGWRDFLGNPNICDECGNNPCTCQKAN
jgi:hypothetical protein